VRRLLVSLCSLVVWAGCVFDWDGLDPRAGTGGASASGGSAASQGGSAASQGGAGGMGTGGTTSAGGASGWFDEAWPLRRALTPQAPPSDLGDVPVLVVLDDTRIDYGATLPGGADLRFVSGGQVLAHDIERWDASGTSFVWVRLPLLAADGSAGAMYMYYGNPDAADGEDEAGTYDADFAAVWHLEDLADATLNANDASSSAAPAAPGQIADGRQLDGMAGYVEAAADPSIDGLFGSGGTVEAWFYADGYGENGFGRLVSKELTTMAGGGWSLELYQPEQNVRFERGYSGGALIWGAPTGSATLGTWTYVALVFDESSSDGATIFLDGQPVATTGPAISGTPDSDAGNTLRIGNFPLSESRTFDGVLDEIRLSRTVRSPAWIAVQHASMTDALIDYGPEETVP